ncbi:TetR family transcriptional regulator [Intrasporangium oryzae NRRL B-24470]|uniref:TetR family transcriptional regulator n=1 Tax=Intrasporangium oryzae NRRL B-24470 TaxID=1386089 RepID=W9G5C1_9MICO|nr:TetR family transcriptional regulator [Intrasporangium oryzae]EWS99987.1 TetR family transcriptional regulator [Intrasporangium oryzae NRRL B-24470]
MSTVTEDCGLRERKKRETRSAIHRAALDLVEEKGYAAVTTDAIAARAGVSARTFFNYYPSKDAAVLGTRPEDLDQVAARIETQPADETPLDCLRVAILDLLAPSTLDRALRAQRRRVLLGEPALAPAMIGNNIRVENALTAALERRLGVAPGAALEPRLTVAASLAAVRACIEHHHGSSGGRDGRDLNASIERAFDLLAAGLR